MKTITHDEKITVANNMIQYGGSFISKLGHALLSADIYNTQKIIETWPEEIERYLNFKN